MKHTHARAHTRTLTCYLKWSTVHMHGHIERDIHGEMDTHRHAHCLHWSSVTHTHTHTWTRTTYSGVMHTHWKYHRKYLYQIEMKFVDCCDFLKMPSQTTESCGFVLYVVNILGLVGEFLAVVKFLANLSLDLNR